MTGQDIVNSLQLLGEKNLEKQVIMFDGPSHYTPCRIRVIEDYSLGKELKGKILID